MNSTTLHPYCHHRGWVLAATVGCLGLLWRHKETLATEIIGFNVSVHVAIMASCIMSQRLVSMANLLHTVMHGAATIIIGKCR